MCAVHIHDEEVEVAAVYVRVVRREDYALAVGEEVRREARDA